MTTENNGNKRNVRPIYRKEYGRLIDCDHVVKIEWAQLMCDICGFTWAQRLERGVKLRWVNELWSG